MEIVQIKNQNDADYVRNRIRSLLCIIQEHRWMIDAYLSDYFVNGYSQKIKDSWWEVLSHSSPSELACLLDKDTWNTRQVWPLSLLAFRKSVMKLSLDRHPEGVEDAIVGHLYGLSIYDPSAMKGVSHAENGRANQACMIDGQDLSLDHCYRRHVKPKKQHEIQQLAKTVAALSRASSAEAVVDVGAGQGHLSRLMSFGYGLKVTTVEAADTHAPKAKTFDKEVKRDILLGRLQTRKNKKGVKVGINKSANGSNQSQIVKPDQIAEPEHRVATIDPTVSVHHFLHTIKLSHFQQNGLQEPSHDLDSTRKQSDGNTYPTKVVKICDLNSDVTNLEGKIQGNGSTDFEEKSMVGGVEYKNSKSDKNSAENKPKGSHTHQHDSLTSFHDNSDIECEDDIDVTHQNIDAYQHDCDIENHQSFTSDVPRFILTGLHACGDLSPTMLRVFTQCPQAVGLASVACCYMKLSTKERPEGVYVTETTDTLRSDTHSKNCSVQTTNMNKLDNHIVAQHLSNGVVYETTEMQTAVNKTYQPTFTEKRNNAVSNETCDNVPGPTQLCKPEDITNDYHNNKEICDNMKTHPSSNEVLDQDGIHNNENLDDRKHSSENIDKEVQDNCSCDWGYPMSSFLKSLPGHQLSYEAMEMACHFADAYHQRLINNDDSLRSHVYRAALQEIIKEKAPEMLHGSTRLAFKKFQGLSFKEYATAALGRLGLDTSLSEAQINRGEQRLKEWHQVVAFYTLRLSMAPTVESLVLLDRLLHLHEQGVAASLIPIFDPQLSPRNFVLLAQKKT